MAWKVEYTDTALNQLRKLDRNAARRVLDYMDQRVIASDTPRRFGRALTGPLGGLSRYRFGEYRVVCDIRESAACVLVPQVASRRDAYR